MKSRLSYPSLASFIAPVPFEPNDVYPKLPQSDENDTDQKISESEGELSPNSLTTDEMIKFNQNDFNDLARDMNLSKRDSLKLLKALSTRNLVPSNVTTRYIKFRDESGVILTFKPMRVCVIAVILMAY